MCQPFAMSAWTVIDTARPAVTFRSAFPPTTVQRTGRSESASRSGTVAQAVPVPAWTRSGLEAERYAATSGKSSRYASLFIRLEIYAGPAHHWFTFCVAIESILQMVRRANPDIQE